MSCLVYRRLLEFNSCGVQLEQDPNTRSLREKEEEYVNLACCCPWKGQPVKWENKSFILTFIYCVWIGKKQLLGIWWSGIIKNW